MALQGKEWLEHDAGESVVGLSPPEARHPPVHQEGGKRRAGADVPAWRD